MRVDLIFILHKIHYRLFNRLSNFAFLALLVYGIVWSFLFYRPLFLASGELEEFYGQLTRVKQINHVGRFEINLYDPKQTFVYYMDPQNADLFQSMISQDSHYRVIVKRVSEYEYLGLHIENSYFQLNSFDLIDYNQSLKTFLLIAWVLGLFGIAHLLYMEKRYYSKAAQ